MLNSGYKAITQTKLMHRKFNYTSVSFLFIQKNAHVFALHLIKGKSNSFNLHLSAYIDSMLT